MLTYLEDFIECISGIKSLTSGPAPVFFQLIRLANYDVSVINSLALQTHSGVGLTDRQYQLALKLVTKYSKQLQRQGVTVPENPPLRIPLRTVDRSSSIRYNQDRQEIQIRFPYNTDLITAIRDFANSSCGEVKFDKQERHWTAFASVPNLVFVYNWAKANGFTIEFDIDQVLEERYAELRTPILKTNEHGSGFFIENNPGSFPDSLGDNGVIDLLVSAGNWQISVDDSVIDLAKKQNYSNQWIEWSMKRMLHVRPNEVSLENFFQWVDTADLWPIVWNTGNTEIMKKISLLLGQDRVLNFSDRKTWGKRDARKEKLLFFTSVLTNYQRYKDSVGILVTDQSIIYQIRHRWHHRACKIVYWGDKILSELVS